MNIKIKNKALILFGATVLSAGALLNSCTGNNGVNVNYVITMDEKDALLALSGYSTDSVFLAVLLPCKSNFPTAHL